MAILQSCCCFQSLRTGCYASVIYALVYFSANFGVLGSFLKEEKAYFTGNVTNVTASNSTSVFGTNIISDTTVKFHMVVTICAGCGLLTSVVLLLGIYFDLKILFVPWISAMILTTIVDVTYSLYLHGNHTIQFDPQAAFLYTLDFFSIVLNMYAVLCVISQYQELMAGRGTARFEHTLKLSPVRYTCQPTGTSCLSSRRPATLQPASPTQSPTKTTAASTAGSRRGSRKHVQFPDFDAPSLRSADLLHANWRQGCSPPADDHGCALDSSGQLIADNRSNADQPISVQNYPKVAFTTDL